MTLPPGCRSLYVFAVEDAMARFMEWHHLDPPSGVHARAKVKQRRTKLDESAKKARLGMLGIFEA